MMVVVVLDDDEVFLRNHQVFPIDLTEDFWFEHIDGRPSGIEARLEYRLNLRTTEKTEFIVDVRW